MDKNKENALFHGEYKNCLYDTKDKLQTDLLFFIKENGLTISQAKELFINTINLLDDYGTILSIVDYERLTGRDVNDGLHS